jgi:(2R)-sulfolactate sulfo-lyase subunit alpha
MIQFLVHDQTDSVGVATQDIKAGETARGIFMDSQQPVSIEVRQDIPLGHKIAMKDHEIDGGVIKYCEDIGRVVQRIAKGEHVHVHNLKTRRW